MSSELHSAVLSLTAAVQQLTLATQSLASAISTEGPPGTCSSDLAIAIIKDSYYIPEAVEVNRLFGHRTAEEGPPDLPDCLKEKVVNTLFYISGDPGLRGRLAFSLGFWAKVALETHTGFECDTPTTGSVVCHWVVLRSSYKVPFRLDNFPDFQRFVGTPTRDIVYQTFQTLCEVEIFCVGAGLPVPPLWRAGSQE